MFVFRYNSITRFNSDLSRGIRPRRKSTDMQHYHLNRKSGSVSSSSSASPSSPPICLPSLSHSSFQTIPENNNNPPYHFETFSTSWSSSSSVTSEDLPSFRSSPISYEYLQDSNNAATSSTRSIEPGYQSFDISMNHHALSYPQSPTASGIHSNGIYKPFTNHNHLQDQTYPGYSHFPLIHGPNDDSADQFAIYSSLPQSPIDPVAGIHCHWDTSMMMVPKSSDNGYKLPSHFTQAVRTLS